MPPVPDPHEFSSPARRRGVRSRPAVSTEVLVLLTSLWIVLTCNRAFWIELGAGEDWLVPGSWWFALTMGAALTSLIAIVLLIPAMRLTVRPFLLVAVVVSGAAADYMQTFGIYLDPGMVRNALHSEAKEARDLLSSALVSQVLLTTVPVAIALACFEVRRSTLPVAVGRRLLVLAGACAVLAASVLFNYQDLAVQMRNHRETRYLATPVNLVYALARILTHEGRTAVVIRQPVALDARGGHASAGTGRPLVLVLVVGETVRAANWGLAGYRRDTTPLLRGRDVVGFGQVSTCGTDTQTSVPCLFSSIGRRNYDEDRIRRSESLLHVLARSGFDVLWRDNQSGCKGVCAGLLLRADRFRRAGELRAGTMP